MTTCKTVLNKITGLPYLPQDMSQRLDGSVVQYNGKPVVVDRVIMEELDGTKVSLCLRYLSNGNEIICELPDDRFDIRPVPMGYINGFNMAVYASRIPVRRYKQGLHAHNVRVDVIDKRYRIRSGFANELIKSRGMVDCIKNNYPSLDEVIELLETPGTPWQSQAFHRRWASALDDTGTPQLYYRGTHVGHIMDSEPVLGKKFHYLKEEIERMAA